MQRAKSKTYDGGLLTSPPRAVVVGIDQSYSGFAVTAMAAQGEALYQSWVYGAPGSGVVRLADIETWLSSRLVELVQLGFKIQDFGMEGYSYGAQMAHMAGELGGMVKLTLLGAGHYPLIIPPANVKKYVTGKGTGVQKNQMLLQVFKNYGVEFDDDNAADSYAIARMVSGRAERAHEKEVLSKLKDPKFREKP